MRWVPEFTLALLIAGQAAAAGLHDAARRGDLAAVEKLLAAGARVDATDGGSATPLYLAAGEGHAAVVARLLAAGGNPRHQALSSFGSTGTPIHAAARNGHLDVVRLLLEAGVDPNLPDDGVGPPLHAALRRGHTGVAKLLRSFGARQTRAEPLGALLASADAGAGREAAGACAVCHELTKHPGQARQGPPLWNVVGRPIGGSPGFEYSDALRALGGQWGDEDLNSYLANPRGFAPGTKMEFRGVGDPRQRAAIITHLRSLSDKPGR
ncbi:MAG TPA: ankyrin repeat domain-containing protein [Burkholderiales bacterium]|nr:ankyrin repeat domain-containing protein [Burkholderiales bacterium]